MVTNSPHLAEPTCRVATNPVRKSEIGSAFLHKRQDATRHPPTGNAEVEQFNGLDLYIKPTAFRRLVSRTAG